MLEVYAQPIDRSVFVAGETIECRIVFINANTGIKQRTKSVQLAWASAQIHCQCTTNESRISIPKSEPTSADLSSSANETSFVPSRGEKGQAVLTSKPTILFCDLALKSGERREFIYKESIPLDAPPSYRGNSIKYAYKITIGTQQLNKPTELLRVSFRVLVVPGLNDLTVYADPDSLTPSNPFRKQQKNKETAPTGILDIALQIIQNLTCRRTTNFYNITNSNGKVARFCLFKQAFRIGDDIIGTFDFSLGTIPCIKMAVSLQSEEQVSAECRKKNTSNSSITTHCRQQLFCLHSLHTHITIPVPLTATPEFFTDLVHLKWKLHFEFVVCSDTVDVNALCGLTSLTEYETWKAPECLQVETMIWDLPVKILATNPVSCPPHSTSVGYG
ncbi:DgyrCDS4517 [Dimorphilus gyrociliatus]|uniref:DgyrCDS4517 n=1 Tax=Dimorphilus gyrociliatus TaxID=2664684 RepID=A0A7I8VHR8_9ANNE|nr:DgyrCDS4517 [Dimorphilus gyrociliatus]